MPPKKQFLQFKITLKDVKPPIWRRLQVPSTYTFWDLHVAIQDVMGLQDCHLHEFRVKDVNGKLLSFGFPDEEFDMEILPCWEYKIIKFMSLVRPTFEYIYDFGDNWRHKVELEDFLPAESGVKYPLCLAGKRNCPPEDCGSTHGYENLLEILADPTHDEYEDTKTWVESMKEGPFDPERFIPSEVEFQDPKKRFKEAFSG